MSVVGVAGEDRTDYTKEEARHIRQRSRRLLRQLLRGHVGTITAIAIMLIISVGTQVAGPSVIAYGIDHALPAVVNDDNWAPLWWTVIGYVALAIVAAVFVYLYLVLMAKVSQSVLFTLRRMLFGQAQRLSLEFHEGYTSGRLVARQTSDLETIQEFIGDGITELINGVLFMGFTLTAMFLLDPTSGFILLVALIPAVLLTRWYFKTTTRIYRETRNTSSRMIQYFVETMTGMRAVQAFRNERVNEREFGERTDAYRDATKDSIRVFGLYDALILAVGGVTVAAVVIVGGLRAANGEMPVGALLAAMMYAGNFFRPIESIGMFFSGYQSAVAALEKISGVLEETPTVPEPANPVPLADATGELVFDDVRFAYSEGRDILPRFDLTIPAGQTVALVGQTGAGKSTLAKLVSRFYDPTEGAVRLDGIDLRELSNEDLRGAIVMVTQEAYLFAGTVGENIALGRPDATREEIIEAAKAVGAHDFIVKLPDGYDTDVNKRGGRVSAGQRQLISFARTFLADPAVLILDEATASLDIPSERLIQEALQTLLADRTAIIIAHRLSTVAIADRVLVMEQGRVIEDGSPAELIELGGKYAALYRGWRDSLV